MKNQKLKIKNVLFFVFIFHLSSFIFHLGTANAQGISLRVSPTLIKIKTPASSEINSPLTIENASEEPVDLNIQLRLFKDPKGNGQPEYVSEKNNKSDIFDHIEIQDSGKSVKSLSLGPKQKKNLELKISIPEQHPSSDYYFSIVFVSVSSLDQIQTMESGGQTSFVNINGGIASNVLLSIKPSNRNQALIEEFSSPTNIQSGPVPFTVKIQNKGSNYINPKGSITIKNMFGQLIGKVDIPETNILANSSRYLASQDQLITYNLSLITPKAVWPEKFLLGFYTAGLSIQTSPDAPPVTKTIRFTALPYKLIGGIIIAVIFFVIIRKRVKAKMSA